MRRLRFLLLCLLTGLSAQAQTVPRRLVAEHFTNSYCPPCADRNPGFYRNLSRHPEVIHLALYPSRPYPACPFSRYATEAQDARARYYGVYGSTPRLVIGGIEVPSGADYADDFLLERDPGRSAFDLRLHILSAGTDSGELRAVVYKAGPDESDSLWLYAALAQDTLEFASHNGEPVHYDVFRRAVWGPGVRVAMPRRVGDSAVCTVRFARDPSWPDRRISATGMLQRSDRLVEQAARSANWSFADTAQPGGKVLAVRCYPNPATDRLFLDGPAEGPVRVYDLAGTLRIESGDARQLDVSSLPAGMYFVRFRSAGNVGVVRFVKR